MRPEREAQPAAEPEREAEVARERVAPPSVAAALELQRTIGNRATGRVLARDYESERSDSTLADAPVELYFNGTTLTMGGQGVDLSWPAVSGAPVAGAFDYSEERQHIRGQGPIPEGIYWIDPRQLVNLTEKVLYERWYATPWGTHRITIHPFSTTETFGRGGFFIHGGATPGSAGCIDLTSHMADFARVLARYQTDPPVKIKLNVHYSHPVPAGDDALQPATSAAA